jgi:hypothetical protein
MKSAAARLVQIAVCALFAFKGYELWAQKGVGTGLSPTAWGDAAGGRGKALVIRGAAVFDSISGAMLPQRTIVVEGDRISAISSPDKPVKAPRGARVIDAKGKFVIPGLIDGHTHLQHQHYFVQMTGDEIMPMFVAAGVTSVRDIGDHVAFQKIYARYADAHPELCPRVFLCSPLLDGNPAYHWDSWAIKTPEEVPDLVDNLAKWGVSTLKIYVNVSHDVFRKIIEEGHKHGLTVTAHLGTVSAQDAIADGLDCIEHIWGLWYFCWPNDDPSARRDMNIDNPACKALIAQIAEHKVMLDPTLAIFRGLLLADSPEVRNDPNDRYAPARMHNKWRSGGADPATREARVKEFGKYKELTGMAYRAGITILAGTDTAENHCPPGFSLLTELELLVQSGLPPNAALQAATINNARALKQTQNLGSVEVGKLADMVIVDANPLDDISNTRKIHRVIRGGIVCDPKVVLQAVPKE